MVVTGRLSHIAPRKAVLTDSLVLIDPGTFNYWNATFQSDCNPPANYPGQCNTDLVAERALGLLNKASATGAPFFLRNCSSLADSLQPRNNHLGLFTSAASDQPSKSIHGSQNTSKSEFQSEGGAFLPQQVSHKAHWI